MTDAKRLLQNTDKELRWRNVTVEEVMLRAWPIVLTAAPSAKRPTLSSDVRLPAFSDAVIPAASSASTPMIITWSASDVDILVSAARHALATESRRMSTGALESMHPHGAWTRAGVLDLEV